ncbi:ubiquitin carboxyl-terminal hydrolase 27 isoform X2 [Selaginella moellendorffii]|uniref:ubiquitin carboxyl-terminal hydrolase 27 isoform X2 n=1 Tax=Selaginella moellendorffii TaxID=88036 RepID=UPI000D1D0091|nr:ubiquitin carboxyl-terminal hydrolase 27 isoform X2 [Selaginella moellendorffii]|eukprot:XP_024521817.1 ubiquitin carboxyl-terminal hydrolase 27 isoform X2 [Selaginella moellendorffii]
MGRSEAEILDVLARLRALQSIPWRCLSSLEGRRGIAALATLVGGGLMGALMLVRALPQWIRGSHGAHQRELTVPGLQNSGNNCFLNAILQALASSQKFAAYLRAYENLEGDEREPSMPLSSALCELLEELGEVAPGHRIVSPRQVMRVLGHYARSFDLGMQQDAAEALSYLAAALQHERMEDFEEYRPTLQSLADVSALSRQMESLIHTDDFQSKLALNYWRQQLRWPMEGTYGSSIICSQCGFQGSMQFHFFTDVSLALPQSVGGYIRKACTIEDCLDQFTMLERVSNFKCSRCAHLAAACFLSRRPEDNKDLLKTLDSCDYDDCVCETLVKERDGLWIKIQGDAYKSLQFGRCPEVLCLHLQRVIVNASGHLEKLLDHISFSTTLDLSPFTIASKQTPTRKDSAEIDPRVFKTAMLPVLRALGSTGLKSIHGDFDANARCIGGAGELGQASPCNQIVEDHDEVASTKAKNEVDSHDPNPVVASKTEERHKGVKRLYDLISVVVHQGSPMSGHYTVYRKVKVPRHQIEMLDGQRSNFTDTTPEKCEAGEEMKQGDVKIAREETMWFAISDADVVKVSEEEVLEARATLLFYELQ